MLIHISSGFVFALLHVCFLRRSAAFGLRPVWLVIVPLLLILLRQPLETRAAHYACDSRRIRHWIHLICEEPLLCDSPAYSRGPYPCCPEVRSADIGVQGRGRISLRVKRREEKAGKGKVIHKKLKEKGKEKTFCLQARQDFSTIFIQ